MLSFLALSLAAASTLVAAQTPGSFADGGNTQVSAMMMFLGNEDMIYILDKAEGNSAQIQGHSAWGAAYQISSRSAVTMPVLTNTFCASGMHLPNGSYVTFGGNGAIGPDGSIGSVFNSTADTGAYDATYQDYDGGQTIRVLNPCPPGSDFTSAQCGWFDNPKELSMLRRRWYSAAEALADGSIVIVGGFVNGGYVNRNTPNVDPEYEGGAAEPTFEFFPPRSGTPEVMQFMIDTSGLNSYAHTYLMPDGRMFVQANWSTILWDYNNNIETPLPPMPNNVARVYPASGATAMLPLTPANNYTPSIIFCGGSNMSADDYGNYSYPLINTWDYPASDDCQVITPEPADGSAPVYQAVDTLPVGRTMGQFIILPTGKMLVVNGGMNGTAGYAQATGETASLGFMPYGESLAAGHVGQPAIYDPDAPLGSQWTTSGLSTSSIARLYHSSAMLLPDASVLIAGSNPNIDVNLTTVYPTTYQAEIFYPPYFAAAVRPQPSGIPQSLTYGGNYFNVTLPASSYSGSANDAADNTTVVVTRGGFTTHAMNMGQRHMQLNNTYTVNSDGSITLHVSQPPPNPNLLQPGPVLFWVVVNGVPSNGTMLLVGSGEIGTQATSAVQPLPTTVQLASVSGSAPGSSGSGSSSGATTSHTGEIIGAIVAGVVAIGVLGALVGVCISRRRRRAAQTVGSAYAMRSTGPAAGGGGMGVGGMMGGLPLGADQRKSDSSAFVPLRHENSSAAWNASSASLATPYQDETPSPGEHYDPYAAHPQEEYAQQAYQQPGYSHEYQQQQQYPNNYQQQQQQGSYMRYD